MASTLPLSSPVLMASTLPLSYQPVTGSSSSGSSYQPYTVFITLYIFSLFW